MALQQVSALFSCLLPVLPQPFIAMFLLRQSAISSNKAPQKHLITHSEAKSSHREGLAGMEPMKCASAKECGIVNGLA